ncbi:O-antigen ligase domain-containing protein [Exiguobacterium sp. SH5S13]|uniref:O-antigen ligase family protein n=1 Tax=Exiguobacterium sp. SH5S13 TaxID=2510959 RepID=UPI00103CBDD4|nr:O-antigen ligase family protein [Exiguobacterium sp. SH5S13]TCI49909.1 O-antigen ligase domain-containing protein [Exiguobacterium sp. SH5S13]
MNYQKKNFIGSGLIMTLIIINSIVLFDFRLYSAYDKIAFYGNFLILISIVVVNKIYVKDLGRYIFIALFLAYGFFTVITTDGGIGSVITPPFSFLLLYLLYDSNFNKKKIKILLFIFLSLNIFWVFNSVGYYSKALYSKNEFLNSNTVGMLVMYTAIYISIFVDKLNIKFSKIISLFIFIFSAWAILNVDSRGALMALMTFIFFSSLFPWKLWRSKHLTLAIFSIVIFIGAIFPLIYTRMYVSGFDYSIPFTTKSLYTGREVIWLNYFYMADKPSEWLFGIGSNAKLWAEDTLNVHNNYLAVITNFGIVGFVLYYGFILKQINNIYKKGRLNKYQCNLIIGFLCVLVYGFVEISTFWYVMFFFNFLFIGLAVNESKIQKNSIELSDITAIEASK